MALPSPLQRSQGIALRRALVLMLMTVVIPGSAQLAVGQKRLGRVAFRIWAGLIALLVLVAL
ncbi:MAG: transcriptional regulator, partial [Phenylobacterium zucineum]